MKSHPPHDFLTGKQASIGVGTVPANDLKNHIVMCKIRHFRSHEWLKPFIKTMLLMKLSCLIILATCLQVSAKTFSQDKITLDVKEVRLEKLFKEIEKKSDFRFVFSNNIISGNSRVSLAVTDASLREVLDIALENTGLHYRVLEGGKLVVISATENEIKELVIKGRVADSDGRPLKGVSVYLKGNSGAGTTTDDNGNFQITLPDDATTLVFSYIGMEEQEVNIVGKTAVNITLKQRIVSQEEIVVVGYGTQRKSDVVSSVVSVKAAELAKVPSSDIAEMLRGKATGVLVTTADASPGSSSNILIRGKRSINGGNSPLVIVDGVQVTDINQVNVYDVSSMEILKDAAAQAIYGARASNGVILITTKRGKIGKPKVNYTAYYGLQTIQKHFETYNGDEFVAYKREAYRANGGNNGAFLPDNAVFSPSELETIASKDYIDWEDKILHVAPITNQNVSISAGSENTKVFSSFNYFGQQGIERGTKYNRGIVRLNIDQTITQWLKVGVNSSWQISEKDNPGTATVTNTANSSMLVRTITTSPLGQIYNPDGSLKLHPSGIQDSYNPLLDLQEITNNTKENRSIMNVFIDVTPIKGLHYRMNASRTALNGKSYLFNSSKSLSGILAGGFGTGSVNYGDNIDRQLENIVNYKPNFGNTQNDLEITFVQSILNRQRSNFTNTSNQIPSDAIGIYYLTAGANQPAISASERNLLSYVGRVQYNFRGKYYLSGSMRADGSSVFGANNKWGYFPSVAVGWNLNREGFLANSKVLDVLKLRLSYGSVGNEGIQPYQSLNTVNPYNYIFGGVSVAGLLPGSSLPNPSLKWETTTTFNAAIDFGFLKNRLNGTVEFYNTETKDLLISRAIVQVTGYSSSISNLGQIQNKGVEVSLNADIIKKKDFNLSAGFLFNLNRNEIIHLYGEDKDGNGKEDDDVANRWFIGQPIDVYYDYLMIGIFSTQEQINASNTPAAKFGDIQVWDRDKGDGVANGSDRVITKRDPKWYGTFNLRMDYKGLDLSADLYTMQGVTKFNTFLVDYWTGGNPRGILNGVKQDYWTPEHTNGTRPRPWEGGGRRFMDQGNVTAGLQDASFVRLQTLSLGYTVRPGLLNKLKISSLRVYLTGQNLFTSTKFESYDPENDARSYPSAVMVTGGIQLGF